MFKIMGHRGASADAPDNTAEAFQLAFEQHSDLIETDVRITADGVLVLEHDGHIDDAITSETTLTALREIHPDLLTVAGALAQFGDKIPFCWEIKAPGVESALINMVRDIIPASIWQRTEFTSFWIESVGALRRHASHNPVGWLTRDWSESGIDTAKVWGASQMCPMAQSVLDNPALIDYAKELGLDVRVWHVASPDMVPELNRLGVYGGTVNFPQATWEALRADLS